jgi:hypothetical protein
MALVPFSIVAAWWESWQRQLLTLITHMWINDINHNIQINEK